MVSSTSREKNLPSQQQQADHVGSESLHHIARVERKFRVDPQGTFKLGEILLDELPELSATIQLAATRKGRTRGRN